MNNLSNRIHKELSSNSKFSSAIERIVIDSSDNKNKNPEVIEVDVITKLYDQEEKREFGTELSEYSDKHQKEFGIKLNFHQYQKEAYRSN